MQIHVPYGWAIFCIAFGVMLIVIFIMSRLSRHFYTRDVVLRKFDIIDLQWPGSPLELENLVRGIYKLDEGKMGRALLALKTHLYIDFIFMPAAYGCVFLLAMKLSWKMSPLGAGFFSFFAWFQLVAWALDMVENFYLLSKLQPNMAAPSQRTYAAMQRLELLKWGIPLFTLMCCLSAVLYFWVNGLYQASSLLYLVILIIETVLFFAAGKMAMAFMRKAQKV